MYRLFILLILLSGPALAQSTYQVDLIVFAHPLSATKLPETNTPLLPLDSNVISLKSSTLKTDKTYTLLPPSQSGLHDEYYLLTRKSQFKVLGQYSWRQSSQQQKTVALPRVNSKGWLFQGTLHVQQGNYYLFNADLQFSPPSDPQGAFNVSQNQRIEGEKVYYLDHPYIGMVVKIHRI